MSHVQQTCPMCSWDRFVRVPQTTDHEFDDLIARHVSRSLQWEWQVHMKDEHAPLAAAYECLTPGAYDDWVRQEGAQSQPEETPPGEGEGETVGVNPLALTPDQAKQLAETMAGTLATIADGIQNWATQVVPAIRAAAEGAARAVRSAGCQCQSSVIGWHTAGALGCLYRDEPNSLAADQERWRQRFAGETETGGKAGSGSGGKSGGS